MGSRCREDGARTTVLFYLASLRSRTPKRLFNGNANTGRIRIGEHPTGTLLRVTESGFDKIPRERRVDALRVNDRGWVEQMKNSEAHVSETP